MRKQEKYFFPLFSHEYWELLPKYNVFSLLNLEISF